ncbi:ABC transporter ATP-binding protein [Sporolactobacillus laevolacticus]|uniref:ABC transporter n=1 Tax=Sporolactobacillus laevolacticus DSM 442 TaxID=1395513 RepID=V6IWP1_9BACL|nr:ABC transporter ATP-binding protein [Sporolactobacillus laevolacticus]EST11677.1 ABC transporter [Sporolactobacillus laevolacticus DSM 442]
MLEAKKLVKYYTMKEKSGWFARKKQQIKAVNGLDLTIKRGEIVGLLGVNGAGKTTTIKMLSTLLAPTSGTLSIDGIDALQQPEAIKRRINMIAGGERMLYWRLSARENLMYFGRLYGLRGSALKNQCDELIKKVGLAESADRPVERYSKGMKQRLQIARGLINDPDYLFLDEPTLGLDAPVARQLRGMVKDLAKKKNKGILLTSHYLEEVEELCDHVYIIEKGHLLLHDTPTRIIQTIVKDRILLVVMDRLTQEDWTWLRQELDNRGIHTQKNETDEGTQLDMTAPFDLTAQFIALTHQRNFHLLRLESKKPNLEDAIIRLAEERELL